VVGFHPTEKDCLFETITFVKYLYVSDHAINNVITQLGKTAEQQYEYTQATSKSFQM
jgi:hypothetical protein